MKKGGPSPNPAGRPKGARNRSNFEKECDKLITIGRDDRGRAIRRRLGDVIDRQLIKQAVEGDLKAIKLVKELELRYATLRFRESPDVKTVRRAIAEEEERQKLVKRIGCYLDHLAQLKKAGVVSLGRDGGMTIAPWVIEEAVRRKSAAREPGPTS